MALVAPQLKSLPRPARTRLDPLLTVPQVADYLRVSRGRAYELVNSGALGTPIRLSPRGLRLRPSDVEKFLADRRNQ